MTGRNAHADHKYKHPEEASIEYNPVEAETPNNVRRLVVDPMENILIGSILIRKYLGIQSVTTMYMWHERYGLPIMKRPDGQWMSSITAIDEWIFMASELERTKRPFPRGTNRTPQQDYDIAKRRLEHHNATRQD